DVLYRIRHEEPPAFGNLGAQVPAELEAICLRCLQKDPRDRYPSAGKLANDLQRWLDGNAPEAATRSFLPLERVTRRFGGSTVAALLLGAALLFAGILGLQAASDAGNPLAALIEPPAKAPSPEERLRKKLAEARPGRPVILLDERGGVGRPVL